jgi:hypothetical protein
MIGRNQVIERDRDRVVARTAFGGTQHDGTFSADVGARDAQGRQDKRNASLTAPTFARRWTVIETTRTCRKTHVARVAKPVGLV